MLAAAFLTPAALFTQQQPKQTTGPDKRPVSPATAEPARDFSQEPVVYKSANTIMRYENDGNGFRETRARILVQTEGGLAHAGQLLFNYNSGNETVEIRSVRVLRPEGTIITTGPENIQDLSAPVARIAPVYSDARQKHVTVAGLAVGDTVEYDVVTNYKPLVPGQFWQSFYFESQAISLDEQLELNVPKDRPLKIKSTTDVAPEVREENDRRVYRWNTSNLSVPKPLELLKSFKIDVRQMLEGPRPPLPNGVVFSTFQSWSDVGDLYAGLERDRREPTAEVRAQAREIVRGKTGEAEKAQVLYEWVARNIRYVSLSFGVGRYQPHAASDVLANRYGDCKDKTTLLEAFLAAEGIHADPALVNALTDVNLDVPTILAFDHVITVASIGGKEMWLDPTTGVVPFGYLLPQLRGQNALVVSAAEASAIRKTPKELAIPTLYKLDVTGAVNKDGNLDGIVKFSARGDLEVLLRLFNSFLPPAQFVSFIQEAMTKGNQVSYGQSRFTEFRLENASDISKPLQGQFHFVGKLNYVNLLETSPEKLVDGVYSALLAKSTGIGWFGKDSANESGTSQWQSTPADFVAPREYTLKVAVTVPNVKLSGTEKPSTGRFTSEFGDYESSAKWDGQTWRAEWRLYLRLGNVSPARKKDYLEFQTGVIRTLNEARVKTETAKSSPATTTNSSATSVTPYSPLPEAETLYKQGQTEAKLENYANAVKIYQSALKIDAKYANAWRELGRSYMYIQDYPNAETAFLKYLALSPDDHLAYLNMAWVLYNEKKYSEEVDLLEKRIENAPGDGDARTRLGAAYLALHQPDRAVPHLERATQIFPKYQFAQFTLGRAYLETHQDFKAADAFQRAIDINPTDAALNSAAYTLAEHKSSLDIAKKWAAQAINEVEVEANQVTLRTQPSRLSTFAQRLSMYWDTFGWVMFQQGDYPTAEKYAFAAWQMRNDSTIGTHLAHIYAARGRREEAVEVYSEVIHNLPAKHDMTNDEQDAGKQLALLQGGDPLKENMVAAASDRFRTLRVVKIENAAQIQGIAQYQLLIGPQSRVIEMEVVGSDSGLGKTADAISSTPMPQSFPDTTIQKVPRIATLACLSSSEVCTLTLASTGSVARVMLSATE